MELCQTRSLPFVMNTLERPLLKFASVSNHLNAEQISFTEDLNVANAQDPSVRSPNPEGIELRNYRMLHETSQYDEEVNDTQDQSRESISREEYEEDNLPRVSFAQPIVLGRVDEPSVPSTQTNPDSFK